MFTSTCCQPLHSHSGISRVCNSVLVQAAESLVPDASSTCSRVNDMAPIAQSAEGVSWVLMVVGPLMAGAGGLDLGKVLNLVLACLKIWHE
jgi:hypothetical protein